MRHLTCSMFVVAGLLVWGTSAWAQQEQWLQYRTTADIYQSIGGSYGQKLSPQDEPPDGVALPKLAGEKPVFLKWLPKIDEAALEKTKGGVWMVLDRTRKNGPYDRLYIDTNLDGSLAEERPIKADSAELDGDRHYATFGRVKITLPGIDGPAAYHLEISYREYPQPAQPPSTQPATMERYARATAAGWYEGEINVDGKKYWCMLIDNDANGCFSDTSYNRARCDVIRIGSRNDRKFVNDYENDLTSRTVGQLVEVDGKLYLLKVADDGATVALAPASAVPMGSIRVPANISYFTVFGSMGHFLCKPTNGLAAVPAGKYSLNRYEVAATDSAEVKWQIREFGAGCEKPFDVAEGKEYSLDIGEPFKTELSASKSNGEYRINQSLRSRNGDFLNLRREGKQPAAPKVRIRNADGTYDKTYTMEFG